MAKIIINPHHRRFDFCDKWQFFSPHWNEQNQTSTRLLDRSVWGRPLPCFPLRLNGTSTATQPPSKTEVTTSRRRQRALTGAVLAGSHPKKPRQHSAVRPHTHRGGGVGNRLFRAKTILTPTASCSSEKLSLLRIPQKCPPSTVVVFIPRHFSSLWYFPASHVVWLNGEECWLCPAGKRERTVLKSTSPIVPHSIYLSEKTGSACELAALPTPQ